MLSHTCKTGLKAAIYLASQQRSGHRKCGMQEIAHHIDASAHTVGKLLQTLVKEKVLCSAKGPSGGFYITQRQLEQPLIKIIEAIDGIEVFTACGMGLSKCGSTHPCPIHDEYKTVREGFEAICRKNTLADLSEPLSTGTTHLAIQNKKKYMR